MGCSIHVENMSEKKKYLRYSQETRKYIQVSVEALVLEKKCRGQRREHNA